MKIEKLKKERAKNFIAYCKKHRKEIDDSFLHDEDLKEFYISDENPTYVILDKQGKIISTASLIIDDYHRRGKRGRFRIFHSEIKDKQYYNILLKEILKHTEGLDKIFIFLPLRNKELIQFMEDLNFTVERYSFLLVREDMEAPDFILPKDYKIKTLRSGKDEQAWCKVRNTSFANLKGHETHITPEMIYKMVESHDYIEGGLMILYNHDKPIGVVRGSQDKYEGALIMNIGPLAIIPEYQGMGLGRSLLRVALQFAKRKGYEKTILCVNGENEKAKALYIKEGFKEVESVVCYKYDLTV